MTAGNFGVERKRTLLPFSPSLIRHARISPGGGPPSSPAFGERGRGSGRVKGWPRKRKESKSLPTNKACPGFSASKDEGKEGRRTFAGSDDTFSPP